MRWLVKLYPADWRERYGDELDALFEQRPSWRAVCDLLLGAADAWRHPIDPARRAKTPRRWTVHLTIRQWAGIALILCAAASVVFVVNPGSVLLSGAPCPGSAGRSAGCRSASVPPSVFLAALSGLLLLALSGVWLQERRRGHAVLRGEAALLGGAVAYLVYLRDANLLPALGSWWPAGQDLGLLALLIILLSLIVQGVIATSRRLLPAWSTLPFAIAPLVGPVLLKVAASLGPIQSSLAVLCLSASWLLLGCALLFASPGEVVRSGANA